MCHVYFREHVNGSDYFMVPDEKGSYKFQVLHMRKLPHAHTHILL